YTGEEIIPPADAYTVKIGKKKLVYGTDYQAEILGGCTEPGKVKVRLSAPDGNPEGYMGEKTVTFTINKGRKLTRAGEGSSFTYSVNGSTDPAVEVAYEKGGARPRITISDKERLLTEGVDYTVSYSKNTKVTNGATARAVVKGKGRYKGSVSLKFAVTKQDLEYVLSNGGSAEISDKAESKKGYRDPAVTLTDLNGKKLKKGTDFFLEEYQYDEATRLVSVRISGKGNYSGSVGPYTYRYLRPSEQLGKVSAMSIQARVCTGYECRLTEKELAGLLYTGSRNAPAFLEPGTDFDVDNIAYSNNIRAGTASVTLKGKGRYGGSITLKFRITPAKREFRGTVMDGLWINMQ
ncbi:MAG: hypothetical protein K6F53_05175, partial [Lachnospiraceae bacterium]|nr:hypothetical protein [Lachnospiraceae bacterium]